MRWPRSPERADDADYLLSAAHVERFAEYPDLPGPESIAELHHVDYDTALEAWELLKERALTNRWEKLGGWPSWVQAEEKVDCPECGQPMSYVLQLEESLRELDAHADVVYVLGCAACGTLTCVGQH